MRADLAGLARQSCRSHADAPERAHQVAWLDRPTVRCAPRARHRCTPLGPDCRRSSSGFAPTTPTKGQASQPGHRREPGLAHLDGLRRDGLHPGAGPTMLTSSGPMSGAPMKSAQSAWTAHIWSCLGLSPQGSSACSEPIARPGRWHARHPAKEGSYDHLAGHSGLHPPRRYRR